MNSMLALPAPPVPTAPVTKPVTKKAYDPYKIRRQMRKNPDVKDLAAFRAYSYTRTREEHPEPHETFIDVENNTALCFCEDANDSRRNHMNPDLCAPNTWCKHVRDALEQMEREKKIPKLAERQAAMRIKLSGCDVTRMSREEREALCDSF